MALRRPHQKSRHGCKTCKRRRVKCDEARPTCSNCQHRKETCDYDTESSLIWAGDRKLRRRNQRRTETPEPSPPVQSSSTSATFDLLNRFGAGNDPTVSSTTLNMNQLELIIQWTNNTHRFFTRNGETSHVWKDLIVEEAFHAPFLMHGVLAVSALQLSLSRPEQQKAFWLGIATAHKGHALPPFLANFSDINSSNAKAMFGFAGLVVAFAFGSALTGGSDADKPSLGALNDAFILCRGVQEITKAASQFLRESTFAPLLNPSHPTITIPHSTTEALDHLENMNSTAWLGEQHDIETYARVIKALRDLAPYTYIQPTSMTLAVGWAIRSPAPYLDYLQIQEPFALVVHAHYCAFLHFARENCFIQSWGSAVLRDIWHILDSTWKEHIDWPINQVFGQEGVL
ncbi:Zn(II)2Cys6 transcription factor [Aspergillus steynii IBT 23096]|uniref:Zn(II)2Cys6 transcription factor n=1 Tax=Aspergillus steynii IBT 23096 TaxID=1392250 RepID=A0A2I2G049_9EURO|nr:Zn(II)2Cys6 transcription factor [Aspergillus steynii IBT 23096]PLB46244.1 Zn(II)2Cys6 transcription factor [Aspergillus steynii IBT 23096]